MLIITTVSGFLHQFEMNDVRTLQNLGYEVHYASNFRHSVYESDSEQLRNMGVVLHPISIKKSPCAFKDNFKAFRELCGIIRKEQISVVHCHNPMGGVLGRLASFFQKGKRPYVLYTVHGFHFYKGAPLINWLLFFPVEVMLSRLTDCLITINKEDYKRALHMPLRKSGKVERIPSVGIVTEKFCDRTELHKKLRVRYGIPENCFYVLTAGELNRNKNQQTLIKAIAILQQKKVHLGICGEGRYREDLEELADRLGVMSQISFLGYRNDLQDLFIAADAFAFPSIREGFAIAPLEALAAGLPIITSERRDSREYIVHGKNGIICKKNTPEEYAEAIQLLSGNSKLRKCLSEEGRKTARKYALPETAKIMKRIYEECQRQKG